MSALRGRVNAAPRLSAIAVSLSGGRQIVMAVRSMLVTLSVEPPHILRVVRRVDRVGFHFRRRAIEQDHVVNRGHFPHPACGGRCSLPHDLVTEVGSPEHRVAEHPQVGIRSRVAMQEDRAGRLEDAPEFEQPHGHHDQVRPHAGTVDDPGRVDGRVDARLSLGDLAVPRFVNVAQSPGVPERRAGRVRADRRSVVPVGVERRVEVDEIDALGVETAQHRQVVAGPHGAVGRVRECHPRRYRSGCATVK